ncbi:MAG: carboxylating nicotinate-nucleotide diphosphorylase [Xanthomonadales bacterium]|nr:carboxylating nicotinate-nucleotide diphosphorylase [Xanthomonadales bacterium]
MTTWTDVPPATIADDDIQAMVERALIEDLGDGDVSAALVEDGPAKARIVCREEAVLCGTAWVEAAFHRLDPSVEVIWEATDGDSLRPDQTVARISGRTRALLSAERTALNFLQALSGTATVTRRYADALAGSQTRVLDTRKTLPGLRLAQKYAVRCGGGVNHRIGLFDAVMLKENHIAAAGSIAAAMRAARTRHPDLPLIVEVESLEQLQAVLDCGGATRALIDDFRLEDMHAAAELCAGKLPLEVSGSVTLERLPAIARTGVDFVSVGALTKHVRAVDFSMRFDNA